MYFNCALSTHTFSCTFSLFPHDSFSFCRLLHVNKYLSSSLLSLLNDYNSFRLVSSYRCLAAKAQFSGLLTCLLTEFRSQFFDFATFLPRTLLLFYDLLLFGTKKTSRKTSFLMLLSFLSFISILTLSSCFLSIAHFFPPTSPPILFFISTFLPFFIRNFAFSFQDFALSQPHQSPHFFSLLSERVP